MHYSHSGVEGMRGGDLICRDVDTHFSPCARYVVDGQIVAGHWYAFSILQQGSVMERCGVGMASWLALLPVLAKERTMERKDADIYLGSPAVCALEHGTTVTCSPPDLMDWSDSLAALYMTWLTRC